MKRVLVFVVMVGFIAAAPVSASASSATPIAAYSFDEGEGETVEDLSGNGHTLAIEDGEWTERGRYGGAIDFDEVESCLSTPSTPDLALTEEFTLEAWVKPALNVSGDPVIVKEAEEGDSFALGLGFQEEGAAEAFIGEGAEETSVASEEEVPRNVWTHLAVSYDGAKLRLYVNGDLAGTEAVDDGPEASSGPLRVGCDEDNGEFAGRIDEARIYNRALSSGEVAADRTKPLQTPQATPIAAYSFDEGEGEVAADLTGNHDGVLENTEWVKGKFGSAIYLDGSNDFAEIPDSPELQLTEEFSLEAWVRPASSQKFAPVISKETSNFYSYRLLAGSREVAGVPEGLLADEPFSWEDIQGEEVLPVDAWSHLALTYDGARLRLYVDGSLVDEALAPHGQASEGPLLIGASGGEHFFKGRIDEVRVYNRALDAGEVAADRTSPLQTPQAGPIVAYSFDEGEGESAEDLSGNKHEGTIEGADWTEKGRYGPALDFDGDEDCLSTPSTTDLQLTEEFTLEAWVRPDLPISGDPVIVKEAEEGDSFALGLGFQEDGTPEAFVGEGVEQTEVASTEETPRFVWTHLAVTYDGAKLRLYVNGELAGTEEVDDPPVAGTGPLRVGCSDQDGEFGGRIDEVRVYNRALEENKLEPNQGPDVLPPTISLGGPLTEGLEESTNEYVLEIQTADGTLEKRGSGVKSVKITVDGEVADSISQQCPQTNCGLQYEWNFDQGKYGFEPHTVTVSAEDQAGNVSSQPLQLATPNGSIPACSPTGAPVEATPDEVKELSGGGSNAIFHGSDEETIEYRSAPSGFDPKTASDEDLDLYGYPPRPAMTDPASRQVWEETVGETTGSAEPGGCMGVSAPDFATASGSGSTSIRYSESHAGWSTEDLSGPANQWRGAASIYTVPKLRDTCTGQPAAHLSYVGVGGSQEASPFFQAGTNQPYGISKNSTVAAFTEFFRGGSGKGTRRSEQPRFENLNIQPGDGVFVVALWKPGPEKILLFVQNLRTNKYISSEQAGKEGVLFDGRKLEYTTAERPLLYGGRFQQQDFGTFGFRGAVAWVSGNGVKALGALGHRQRMEMQRSKGGHPVDKLMVSTSRISSDGLGFQAKWHNCHP
jgi:hypothetical protein